MRRVAPGVLALVPALVVLLLVAAPSGAKRKANHDGWPTIDGALIINKLGQSRPIDARPGQDPFAGTDPTYRCDGDHQYQGCFIRAGACIPHPRRTNRCATIPVMPYGSAKHNELLGGHGNDTIYAGDAGDVIWGDYNYPANPVTQRDTLTGGPGQDFIYASHGFNVIHTGGGSDQVKARYGRGEIHCDSADTTVNLSRRSRRRYKLFGCTKITLKPIGTREYPN
ncbi:MAG: calcium-binding protein [Solirubrobacterales bacterium]|nr:calcium-binding protein [Solirubrobacterales bacterium]